MSDSLPEPDRALRDLRVEIRALIDAIDRTLALPDPYEKAGELYLIRSDLRRLVLSDSIEP